MRQTHQMCIRDSLSVDGIELDKCNIRIEDDFYAYASTSNDKIEIKAYKVGTTKDVYKRQRR